MPWRVSSPCWPLVAGACPGCAHKRRARAGGARARAAPRRRAVSGGSPTRTTSRKRGWSSRRCPPTPPSAPALRAKLLHYLLDPVLALNPAALRREVRDLENDDVYDVIFESFRDALALFDPGGAVERNRRGSREASSACCARPPSWSCRLLAARRRRAGDAGAGRAQRRWRPRCATGATASIRCCAGPRRRAQLEERGMRRSTSAIDVLESALGDWPAPAVVKRLDALYLERQQRFVVRRCAGRAAASRRAGRWASCCSRTATRCSAPSSAWRGVYLRAGLIGEAARAHGDARRHRPATIPSCARLLVAGGQARRRAPPTSWRWRAGSCRASICWAAPPPTRPTRWSPSACWRPASRATPAIPSCWCSRATSRACCRRTSWPSVASRRPQLVLEHDAAAGELTGARLRRADRALLPAPAAAAGSRARHARRTPRPTRCKQRFAETQPALPERRDEGAATPTSTSSWRAATSTPGRSTAPSRCSCARARKASRPPR